MGLAVLALAQITALDFHFLMSNSDLIICFTGPFLGYNFIKFHRFLIHREEIKIKGFSILLGFLLISALLFLARFFLMPLSSQLLLFLTLALVLIYCLPLPGLKINFRGFRGFKIHLVALSWVITTVFLPLSMADIPITERSWFYSLQRYLFVLVATLPFEISDLKLDDPHLSTWPQKQGILGTKMLGVILLLVFVILEVCYPKSKYFFITIFIVVLLIFVLLISKAEQSKYFSSFWVEGIPILWLVLRHNLI